MWMHLFIVFGLSLSSVTQIHASDAHQSSLLGRWFFHVISRGFYLMLICMIFVCFVISAVKNKVSSTSKGKPDNTNSFVQSSEADEAEDFNENREGSPDNLEALKEKLRQAEELINALQNEIGDNQKTFSSLENSVGEIDGSQSCSKDEIINTEFDISLGIENMRHDNALIQRQLEEAKRENENLIKKIEVLQREARISEAALRDQQSLSDRLRGARSELDGLKSQLQGIKVERDTAVRIAAEHIYKMTPEMTPQKIEVIEAMIDAELKRVREEEEAAEEASCKTDYELTFMESNETIQSEADTVKLPCPKPAADDHKNPVGDAPSVYTNQDDEPSNSSEYDSGTLTNSFEYSYESRQSRMVTRSPAFRAFLQNVFRQTD